MKQLKATKVASRFLLYVGIALGVLVAIALTILIGAYVGYTHEPSVGWLGLAGFTPLIFWSVVKSLRNRWKRPSFWLAVAALLVLHILAFAAVLTHYPRWPLLWFIPVSFIEAGVFVMILGKLFSESGHPPI